MAGPTSPPEALTGAICCFCGGTVEFSDDEYTRLTVEWVAADEGRRQWWSAHHACLAKLMHEQVSGEGPFFGDARAT